MLWNIYEAKLKYELLNESLKNEMSNITISSNVNLIIDLKQIYRKIFRASVELDSEDNNYLTLETERITSDVLSVISHYRNYFYKKGKYTKFYFLYSESICDKLISVNPNYKKDYYERYLTGVGNAKIDLIKRVNKALKFVINLIPNCFYTDTSQFDEFCYAKYLVDHLPQNELKLILTNDDVMLQLVNNTTYVVNLRGNASAIVKPSNFYSKTEISEEKLISNNLFNLILAIAGCQKYSVKGISNVGMKRSYDMIKMLLENGTIQDSKYAVFPLTTDNLVNEFPSHDSYRTLLLANLEIAKNNFELFTCEKMYQENLIAIGNGFVENKKAVSYNTFIELNAQVFRTYPLNIDFLLRGELV